MKNILIIVALVVAILVIISKNESFCGLGSLGALRAWPTFQINPRNASTVLSPYYRTDYNQYHGNGVNAVCNRFC